MERGGTPETTRSGGGARPAGDVMPDERARDNKRRDRDLAATDRERPAAREGNGAAIAALVVGILAILVLVLSLGTLFIVALPLGIAAIVLGVVGKRKAGGRGSDGHGHAGAKHRGKARAGFWLGLVTTILSILALIGAVALFSGGEGFQDEIRDLAPQQEPQTPGVDPDGD